MPVPYKRTVDIVPPAPPGAVVKDFVTQNRSVAWLVANLGAGASALLVWVTGILSGLTDNVPLAAMLAKMLPAHTTPDIWWAAIIGGNLGGNITPIGSAAVVVGVTLMKREGIQVTFTGFSPTNDRVIPAVIRSQAMSASPWYISCAG